MLSACCLYHSATMGYASYCIFQNTTSCSLCPVTESRIRRPNSVPSGIYRRAICPRCLTSHRTELTVSGQQSETFPSPCKEATTDPSPLKGLPSQTTKSWTELSSRTLFFDDPPRILSILVETRAIACRSVRPAYLPAHQASCARPWIFESLFKARPSRTPASDRTLAGLSVNGGPESAFLFSQLSGAPRLPVRMTGIPSSARDLATYSVIKSIQSQGFRNEGFILPMEHRDRRV